MGVYFAGCLIEFVGRKFAVSFDHFCRISGHQCAPVCCKCCQDQVLIPQAIRWLRADFQSVRDRDHVRFVCRALTCGRISTGQASGWDGRASEGCVGVQLWLQSNQSNDRNHRDCANSGKPSSDLNASSSRRDIRHLMQHRHLKEAQAAPGQHLQGLAQQELRRPAGGRGRALSSRRTSLQETGSAARPARCRLRPLQALCRGTSGSTWRASTCTGPT